MTSTSQEWVLFCLALGMVGCEARAPVRPVTIRDSLGVRLIETVLDYEILSAVNSWRLADDPLMVSGSEGEGEEGLYQVKDASLLPDGGVVVANGGSGQIKVFRSDGKHVMSYGHPGAGPGDFQGLSRVRVDADVKDRIWAYDVQLQRMTVLALTGEVLRTRAIRLAEGGLLSPVGWMRDGAVFVTILHEGQAPESGGGEEDEVRIRTIASLHLFDAGGRHLTGSGSFPGNELNVDMMTQGRRLRLRSGTAPTSLVKGTAGRQFIVVGTTAMPEVRFYSAAGSLVQILRWRLAESGGMNGSPGLNALDPGRREEAGHRRGEVANASAFEDLLLDADDHLWIRVSGSSDDRQNAGRWIVFSPDGDVLATALMPVSWVPYEIHDRKVLGLWRDSLGVETVRRYRLTEARASGR